MRLTTTKALCLGVITIGLVTSANGSAEAHPQISALSPDALASDNGFQYLAQFDRDYTPRRRGPRW